MRNYFGGKNTYIFSNYHSIVNVPLKLLIKFKKMLGILLMTKKKKTFYNFFFLKKLKIIIKKKKKKI
jgi:hypothetical protein